MPIEYAIALGACLLLVLISAGFFRIASAMAPRKRIAASAHGLLVALILPYGLAVDALSAGYGRPVAQLPIFLMLLLAAASIAFSVWAFRHRWLVHLWHLVTIALAIPFTWIGSIAIVGWT